MRINQGNIQSFIAHLFRKRTGNAPSQELLQSWAQITEEDIITHLRNMTQQWGWSELQLQSEINAFLNPPISTPQPEKIISTPPPYTSPHIEEQKYNRPKKGKKYLLLFVVITLLSFGGYVFMQYSKFNNLERLYSVTDNVTIRDAEGKTVGRMDIFGSRNATTSLRAADNTIYNIVVDKQGNISESRKLLKEDATFKDYFWGNAELEVYVNKNFLTNNADYAAIQKTVLADISKYAKEMTQLKSHIRKVIIGSMGMDEQLKNLYIKNPCGNNTNEYTSILKHTLKDKKTVSIICKLSDNKYYKLKGNPDENIYYPPQQMQFLNPVEGNLVEIEATNLLFKFADANYHIFSCNKVATGVSAHYDNDGDIDYFMWQRNDSIDTVDSVN